MIDTSPSSLNHLVLSMKLSRIQVFSMSERIDLRSLEKKKKPTQLLSRLCLSYLKAGHLKRKCVTVSIASTCHLYQQ